MLDYCTIHVELPKTVAREIPPSLFLPLSFIGKKIILTHTHTHTHEDNIVVCSLTQCLACIPACIQGRKKRTAVIIMLLWIRFY
jgi:hypothetical protein